MNIIINRDVETRKFGLCRDRMCHQSHKWWNEVPSGSDLLLSKPKPSPSTLIHASRVSIKERMRVYYEYSQRDPVPGTPQKFTHQKDI
jgi:hypothetical protein